MSDTGQFHCVDCGWNTFRREYYMVHDQIWAWANMTTFGGMLCIDCIEGRLGRQLTTQDFADCPLNHINAFEPSYSSNRLRMRMWSCV